MDKQLLLKGLEGWDFRSMGKSTLSEQIFLYT